LRCHRCEREDLPVDRREETVVFVRVVRFTGVTADRRRDFAAMDPSETPGSRVSVDTGELKVERAL
jgi:hypothetical protein